MKCKAARELFQGRIDGGLSYEEERSLQGHLAACPDCDGNFVKLSRTVDLLRDLPEIEPGPTFLQDVLRRARLSDAGAEPDPLQVGRVRGFIDSLRLSRPWSVAYVALGLAIGVGGSSLITQNLRGGGAPGTESAVSATAAGADANANTPMPSGQFEDLVKEMLARAENAPPAAAEDSTGAASPDWGSEWSASGARDRQVQASPPVSGGARERGAAYVVF